MKLSLHHIFRVTLLFICLSLACLQAMCQDSTTYDTTVHVFQPPPDTLTSEHQEDIPHFEEVKAMPVIHNHRIPDTVISHLKMQKDYWYADSTPGKRKGQNGKGAAVKKDSESKHSIWDQEWFKNIIWFFIIIAFTAVIISYLYSGNVFLFRKQARKINRPHAQEEYEDIFSLNFDDNIHVAVNDKNYRLATRLLYLRTLKDLSDKGLINYKQEKTNSDYLFQLGNTSFYNRFLRLTRSFEYTWYGKFNLSQEGFDKVFIDFSTFKKEIGA